MSIALTHDLLHQWQQTLAILGADATIGQQHFVDLVSAYSRADRCYHNLNHINQVLQTIQTLQALAHNEVALQLAAWFHDVIYDPQAIDNEAQSALYAERVLLSLTAPATSKTTLITTIKQLILATKNHEVNPKNIDNCIFLDADLAILGTTEKQYWKYAKAIRKEYAWVSDADYSQGRRRVLASFLQRDRLYATESIWQTHELSARRNLQAEIDWLGRGFGGVGVIGCWGDRVIGC
jgi:predicted metal-dependent HD superfamily phosphohydrolase